MGWRARAVAWVESRQIQGGITFLIACNAITLGVGTSDRMSEALAPALGLVEGAVLAAFVAEIGLKLFGHGLRFFRSGWNVFDFIVVGISLMPAAGPFAILRTLRALRLLRLLSTVRRLRRLVEALLQAIPSIAWVSVLLVLVFYVFGVVGTELFGSRFPDWFGTLGASMYTLFQVMTLESWSMGIARPVMEVFPFAWLFFIPFILVTAFTVLNLFIGIIVNAMQSAHWDEEEARRETGEQRAHEEREELLRLLREVRDRLERLESRGSDVHETERSTRIC